MPSWFSSSSSSRRDSHRPSSTYSRTSSHGSAYTRGSSYYKRRPRDGYVNRLIEKLKHLLRELWYYARRNPLKVFMFIIPLISGGVLAGIAKTVGIQLPGFLMSRAGGNSRSGYARGGGYYGSEGYGRDEEPGLGGLNMGTLMNAAKAFL